MDNVTTATRTSRLLELPAEIRNQIFTYAVVQEEWVIIREDDCSKPTLLETCRQLRKEAEPIFYKHNTFAVRITNCKIRPQPEHWFWLRDEGKGSQVKLLGNLDWTNLKEWLRLYWEGKVGSLRAAWKDGGETEENERKVVCKVWEFVDRMMDADVDWNTTETMLEVFRDGLDAKKGDWTFQ